MRPASTRIAALTIAKREFGAWFRTPAGYVLAAASLVLNGLQLNAVAIGTGRRASTLVLETFLLNAGFVVEAIAALMSVRLVLGESTAPLLLSAPIRDRDIVVGKFLGAFGVLSAVTLASLYLPALIFVNGTVSLGHIGAGYLGMLLVGAAVLAIGSAAAASTRYGLLAVALTGAVLGLMELSYYVADIAEPTWRAWLRALAPVWNHHRSFRRGLLQLSDVVYLVSLTYLGLLIATRLVARRRSA